ncbi:MAG: efflux RND transporter periplasmic adaptor subunit [Bacteroidetes bacterium]|nr:efflux RND transporter periplasmic adaptor subunit [Bacteroidota bacterium]MBS1592409.1 efflux RND transporter periplasmic adaptor subunit [Bacteroidota bacterium]MBS1639358.1 efflux RND transporter periplasmic adaptor subunit [Bacteroidota bacterium]
MIKRKIYILSSLLILIVTACKEKKQPETVKEKAFELSDTMAKMITIDTATLCNIDNTLTLGGEVSFNENTVNKVFPRNSGQVIESKVTIGDKVTAGQVLAVIKSADIAGNYADISSADADIKIAKKQLDKATSLYKSGLASESDLTEATQNYQKTLAVKRKLEATLNINGGNHTNATGTYVLTSPINGYVVEKKVNTGNYIRQDMSDNLYTISDLKEVWINANVFEADIPNVKEGYNVEVSTLAYPNKIFKGKIDKVSEVLDPTNKTLRVRIKLPNNELLLKPEMFAKVVVNNKENTQVTCIPTTALITQNGKTFVVVYNNKSNMKIAEVVVLKTVGGITYLASGLTPGQQIITKNELLIFQQLLN